MRKGLFVFMVLILAITSLTYAEEKGEKDTCEDVILTRGDIDGNGVFNIIDVVYFLNYLYKGGPAPATPYPIYSADLNCDCVVNILDLTRAIGYLYKCKGDAKCGWIPCSCETWIANCGPELY